MLYLSGTKSAQSALYLNMKANDKGWMQAGWEQVKEGGFALKIQYKRLVFPHSSTPANAKSFSWAPYQEWFPK